MSIPSTEKVYDLVSLNNETSRPLIYYHFALNNKRERVAIIYRFTNIILITHFDGELIKKLAGKDNQIQVLDNNDENQIITYYEIDYDEEYIYCLYKNQKRLNGDIPIYPREIHVFDWDGNQISKLFLEYDLASFKVDLVSRTIYTYSPEANSFVTYNIEHLIPDIN